MKQPPRRVGPFRAGAGFREALGRARDEAFLRHHRQIRPGHILLGVALISDERVDAMLDTLGVARSDVAERAAAALVPAVPAHDGGPDLAYTRRGVHVLNQAALLAEQLEWGWLGAAHLLVALGEEDWGAPRRVMSELGVIPSALRSALASAQPVPPAPSDDPPIFWWDFRTAPDA
ncbi:MAG TPA: Clp protease N-terminal domain-containing protein [Gemmatimonadaceae bacterium]|nr:Clp protease N-terminal domain-containing protein [Gemmatimonadaceae bacterium]